MCCTCGCGLALAMAEANEKARLEQQQASDGRFETWSEAPAAAQALHHRGRASVRGWEALKRSLRLLTGTTPVVLDMHLDLHKAQTAPSMPTPA